MQGYKYTKKYTTVQAQGYMSTILQNDIRIKTVTFQNMLHYSCYQVRWKKTRLNAKTGATELCLKLSFRSLQHIADIENVQMLDKAKYWQTASQENNFVDLFKKCDHALSKASLFHIHLNHSYPIRQQYHSIDFVKSLP